MQELINEISMGPFGSDIKKSVYTNSGVPVLNGSNLQGFTLKENTFGYVSEEKADSLKKCNAHRGDIIVTHRGTLGQIVYIPNNSLFERYVISQSQFRFNLKPELARAEFIVYYFHTREGQHKILSNASQVGVPALARATTTFRQLEVKVPPLPVQDKIVGILSALDSKIENNNKINANLEAQAEALFKSWFVDFTPFKDQPFVDSELGPIPQGWKVGTLGDIANIIMGQSPAGSSYNERGNGVIFYQGRTEFGFRFPNVRLYTTMPKRYAEPMSILLSVRAPVGDINVAIEKCCIGRGLASISSKRGLHSFLLYLVKSLKNRLEVFNGEGTVFGSINKNTLMQFKIIIPPIEMQEKFNEIIQRHDCMVLELHKEIINLSTQRDTLLPKLMSGEIKL